MRLGVVGCGKSSAEYLETVRRPPVEMVSAPDLDLGLAERVRSWLGER